MPVDEDIIHHIDTRSFTKVRYKTGNPQKKNTIQKRPHFELYNEETCIEKVPSGKIKHVLTEDMIEKVKNASKTKRNSFFFFPAGNPKKHGTLDFDNSSYPTVIHQQGEKHICLLSAFTSAIHYMGFEEKAEEIGYIGSKQNQSQNCS